MLRRRRRLLWRRRWRRHNRLNRRRRNFGLLNRCRFFFDSRLNNRSRFRRRGPGFNRRRFRFRSFEWRRFDNGFRRSNFDNFRGSRFFDWLDNRPSGLRYKNSKLLSELVGQTVFDRVGVRRYRHAQVLQFANDFGIVAI